MDAMHYAVESVSPSQVIVAVISPGLAFRQVLRAVAMTWDTLREAARHEEFEVRAVYERLLAEARGLADSKGLGWRGTRRAADRSQIDDARRHYISGSRKEMVWIDADHARAMLLDREAPTCATHLEGYGDEGETLH